MPGPERHGLAFSRSTPRPRDSHFGADGEVSSAAPILAEVCMCEASSARRRRAMRTEKPRPRVIHLMSVIAIFAVALATLPLPQALALSVIESLLLIVYLAGSLKLVELIVAMAIVFTLFIPSKQ